jgi:hypothetical protein
MQPFTWKNCYSDIAAARNGGLAKGFLSDVVLPSIYNLEEKITAFHESDGPFVSFQKADTEELLSQSKKAFALSIQSIWERQLRVYLKGCAAELRPSEGLEEKAEKANWSGLAVLFKDLRGIELKEFPSFPTLDTLHHVGNACRHGDGISARKLVELHPEWWPQYGLSLENFFASFGHRPHKVVATMRLPTESLSQFAGAIDEFWGDATYIYNESIEQKHASLEELLARERAERHWRPSAR